MSDTNALPADAVPLSQFLGQTAPAADAVQSAPAKPPTSIELELADGRKVTMERPKVSLSLALSNILADSKYGAEAMETERMRVKSLLYISGVDGQPYPRIADPISRRALEQLLGDENLDGLFVAWTENFPPLSVKVTALKN